MHMRRAATLMTLLAAEVGAVLILLDLDPHGRGLHPASFTNAPPEDAVVAAAQLLGLALALWLLASTAACALARASRIPRLLQAVQWTTPPSVRRLVDGIVVTTIVAGSTVTPSALASAAPVPDGRPVVHLERDVKQRQPARPPGYQPHAAGDFAGSAPVYRPRAAGDPPPTAVATGDPPDNASPTNPITPVVPAAPVPPPPTPVIASYTVGSGDNLWRIAAAHLAAETGRPIQQLRVTDIETYWSRVVSQNRSHLRSRNPDLIFAGEVIVLPRLVEQPE